MNKPRFLMIEEPDNVAVVDFLGPCSAHITCVLTGNELHVTIMDSEYPNLILEDKCYTIARCAEGG